MQLSKKLFFGIIAFFYLSIFTEIKISDTKDLFTIIKEEYKYLSPFQGMIWWKNNLIENMYRLGNDNHATIKLIKNLFYLQKDGTFDCTRPTANTDQKNKPGNAAAYFTIEVITEFLLLLENNKTREELSSLKERIDKKFIRNFIARYPHTFPPNGNFIKNIRKILRLLCESAQESLDSEQNKAFYIPHMTQNILLAYMWKKAEAKQDFIGYFKNLKKGNIDIIQTNDIKLLDAIVTSKYAQEDLIAFFDNLQAETAQSILDNYEFSICSILSHKPMEVISHESCVSYKDENFSDCGETLILNFFNFILFDPKKNIFDINVIEQNGAQINKNLREFYEKNNNPGSMNTKKIHDEWAIVVSEIPEVIYKQPDFFDSGNPRYCNIAGIGHIQILKVFKHLLGIDNFDDLIKICSRKNYHLSYMNKDDYLDDYNTIIFYINNNQAFELQSRRSHFLFKVLEPSIQNNFFSDQIIKKLIGKNQDIRALSLLSIIKSPTVFEHLASKNFSKTPLSLLNFAFILPAVKNPNTDIVFIETLFDSLELGSNQNSCYIIEIIKKAYKQLPDDFYYRSILAKLILKYKEKKLYDFLKNMFEEDPIEKSSADYRYYTLVENILKAIIINEKTDLYDWFETLFKMVEEIGFAQYFLEFLITDNEYNFTTIVNQPIKEFVSEKFFYIQEDVKKELCDVIIYNKLSAWYFLLISYLDSLDKNILNEVYTNNSKNFQYQNFFSSLLRSNKQEIYEGLMDKFGYMNNLNKSIALKVFANMPNWNNWIKDNFTLLNSDKDMFLLDQPLEVIALKLLIEQNDPAMREFIKEMFLNLSESDIYPTSTLIIQGNHEDFFYLVTLVFEKLGKDDKFGICKSIILYNRYIFYPVIDKYLLAAKDCYIIYILKLIVSYKYLYKNNKIGMLKENIDNHEDVGVLIKLEDYANWYPLVTYWLQQLPIEKRVSIIYIIKKNKITSINIKSNIANLQFS